MWEILVEVVEILTQEIDVSSEVFDRSVDGLDGMVLPGHQKVTIHVVVPPDPLVEMMHRVLRRISYELFQLLFLLPDEKPTFSCSSGENFHPSLMPGLLICPVYPMTTLRKGRSL